MGNSRHLSGAGIAIAIAVTMTLSACGSPGGGSGSRSAAATTTTTPSETTATTATTPSGTVATSDAAIASAEPTPDLSTPSSPPQLTSGQLRAALLPPARFGSNLKFDSEDPVNRNAPASTVPYPLDSDVTCDTLITGGPVEDSLAFADGSITGNDANSLGFYEAAVQYDQTGAATMLGLIEQKAAGTCAKSDSSSDGTPVHSTDTVTAKAGLGDAADLIEEVETFPSNPSYGSLVFDTIAARYGDVMVVIGCSGSRSEVHTYDLDARVKALAGNLGLS